MPRRGCHLHVANFGEVVAAKTDRLPGLPGMGNDGRKVRPDSAAGISRCPFEELRLPNPAAQCRENAEELVEIACCDFLFGLFEKSGCLLPTTVKHVTATACTPPGRLERIGVMKHHVGD